MLAITLAVATLAPAQEDAGRARFDSDLEVVAEQLAARDWDAAYASLQSLLEEHARQPYVRQHRTGIESDVKRCLFWSGRAEPKPAELISGRLHKFSPSTGQLRVSYRPGELGDWVETAEGEGALSILYHPAVFQSDYSVEVEGTSYDPDLAILGCLVFPLRCFGASMGREPYRSGSRRYQMPARISEYDRGRWGVVDINEKVTWEPGDRYRIKLVVKRRTIEVSFNGKRVLKADKHPELWGQAGFVGLRTFDTIEIKGRAERSWMEGVIDDSVQAEWDAFERDFRAEQHLPAWFVEELPVETDDDWAILRAAVPGPELEGQDELLADALERFVDREWEEEQQVLDEVDDFLGAIDEEQTSEQHRHYLRSLVYYAVYMPAEARESAEQLCELEPDFPQGRLLECRILRWVEPPDVVVSAYAGFVEDFPEIAEGRGELAWALINDGRIEEAAAHVRDALEQGLESAALEMCARTLARRERGPDWNEAYELATEHYVISSDIDNRTCRDAGRTLEAAHRLYAKEFGTLPEGGERVFPVYLFSGEASYASYAEDLFGSVMGSTAGMYHPGLEQLLIWNIPERDAMMLTVRHEGLHQYLDALFDAELPRWLNEGLAEYYEAAEFKGNRWTLGRVDDEHLFVLRAYYKHLTPIPEFVHLDPARFMRRGQLHYPQAWAFVHFLRHSSSANAKLFSSLLSKLSEGVGGDALIHAVFDSVDLHRMNRDFRRFVLDLEWERER